MKKILTWAQEYKKKIIDPINIEKKADEIRKQGCSIATLNGSFDLLHAGHLQIIFEASQMADMLIVALNTDRSIREYKSHLRPLIPLEYRLQMIAALEFVDYLTYFDETTPCDILSKIKPNVHVNGKEYGESCIEAETVRTHGGHIHLVELVPGLSTTQILESIKKLIGKP